MTRFDAIKRGIVARKSPVLQFAFVVCGVAIAALLRWAMDYSYGGVRSVSFLPVIVLSAIYLEWQFATLAAVVCFTATRLFSGMPAEHPALTLVVLSVSYLLAIGFLILGGHIMRTALRDAERQADEFRVFNEELQHRARNALQLIKALASRASKASDPAEFYRTLSGRIDALAKANQLLGVGVLRDYPLAEMVRIGLEPFQQTAITAQGPDCVVTGEAGLPLMMALHELGTNATKYGALSADAGRVTISWQAGGGTIDLLWEEAGGPPVSPPRQLGLGSRILTAHGALRRVDMDYRPAGLICRITVPERKST